MRVPFPCLKPIPSNKFSNTGVTARANKIDGNAKTISIVRDKNKSTFPPKNPAISPIITPNKVAKIVAVKAISSEVRAPNANRRNMSRPVRGSTPNQ